MSRINSNTRRRRKIGRDISGVLLLDKPKGVTSNKILQEVKQLFFAKKAGHTGSLDPLATGLLPICFGEATKFSQYLLNADKKYQVVCQLGVTTDSGDSDGNIIKKSKVGKLKAKTIKKILESFLGNIQQIPPMHSAVKINGEPLYKKAHRGEIIEREPRNISIYSFDLIEINDTQLTLEVHCSKGTYVRTLVEDLGENLGCGAHVIALRRTMAGAFNAKEMVTMATLKSYHQKDDGFKTLNEALLPASEMTREFPQLNLNAEQKLYLCQGQAMRINGAPKFGMTSLFFNDEFIGLASILEDGRVEPKRLIKQS